MRHSEPRAGRYNSLNSAGAGNTDALRQRQLGKTHYLGRAESNESGRPKGRSFGRGFTSRISMTMAYLHLGLSDIATLQFIIAVCRATLPSLASRIPGISVSFMSKGMGACLTTTFRLVADSKATPLHEKLGIGTSYCPMLSRTTLTPRLPSPAKLLTTPAFAKNRLNNLFPCIRRIDMDSCVCVCCLGTGSSTDLNCVIPGLDGAALDPRKIAPDMCKARAHVQSPSLKYL